MSLPDVTITELDGALGVLPAGVRLLAIAGPATAGPLNVPAAFARDSDIRTNFVRGPLVELACYAIAKYQKPVVVVRTAASDDGTVSGVTSVKTGSAVVTVDASPAPAPIDDLEVKVKIVAGGTRGTPGITYRVSFDDGRKYGPVIALGSATSIDLLSVAGISLEIGTGTMDAGDTHKVVTTQPVFDPDDLKDALDALGNTTIDWECVVPAGPLDADLIDQLETSFSGFHNSGRYCYWMGHARLKTTAETDAEYQAAVSAALGSKDTTHGGITAGDCKLVSQAGSGSTFRRPLLYTVAPLQQNVSEEINIADVDVGELGVSIRDANGNPDEHDESINPGLDDARFITARTWPRRSGVYVTKPRLFSAEGSDFQLIPHRRVMNLGNRALYDYFLRRLSQPVLIDPRTGRILEREALEIEAGARAAMRALIMAKPKASSVDFILSRVDDVLATRTLSGAGEIVPYGYPEHFVLTLQFVNPANRPVITQAA